MGKQLHKISVSLVHPNLAHLTRLSSQKNCSMFVNEDKLSFVKGGKKQTQKKELLVVFSTFAVCWPHHTAQD